MTDTTDDTLDAETSREGTETGSMSVDTAALGGGVLAGDAPSKDDEAGPDSDGGSR